MWVVFVGLCLAGSIGLVLVESPARNPDSPGKKSKPQGSVPAESPARNQDAPGKKKKPQGSVPVESPQDSPGKKKKPQGSVPAESPARIQDSPGKKKKPQGSVPTAPPASNQDSPKKQNKPQGSVPTASPASNQDSPKKQNEPQGVTPKPGCYGNIMEVPTTGVDCATAMQDNVSYCGVNASQQMAETDLKNITIYKTEILEVGSSLCMDPAVIAGIISRESCAGAVLTNAWCEGGKYFGLMQIDKRLHVIKGAWNSKEHISQGTEILINMIKAIKKKFSSWTQIQQLKGGIAAYSVGPENIISYSEVDNRTAHSDYSNDVVARVQYYKLHGY